MSFLFFEEFCPVIEIGLKSLTFKIFIISFRCWSTSATVGAIIKIQQSFSINFSATDIHATAVFPAAVGKISNIEFDSTSATASS